MSGSVFGPRSPSTAAGATCAVARRTTLGAPVLADKRDLTNEQLHDTATEQKIPG
jgi:hypothetical protein